MSLTRKTRGAAQRGNAFLEAGFIFVPLLAIILAICDFGFAIFLRANMQNAVREGVRFAVTYQTLPGLCQDDSVKKVVQDSAAGFLAGATNLNKIKVRFYLPTNLNTPVTGVGTNAPGNVVEVGVEGYSFSWMAPLLRSPASPFIINVYAADRMEGLAGGTSPPCR